MPPSLRANAPPETIQVVSDTICVHNMCCNGLHIIDGATLHTNQIAVAHQGHLIAVDADDAMYHITTTCHPCQHNIALLQPLGFLQDNTLPTANDKGQHATAVDGKGHTHTLTQQPDNLF